MLHHVHQMGNGHGHQNARKFGLPRSATDAEHVTVARTTDPASGIPAAAAGGREHAVAVVVAIAHVHATPAREACRKLGKTDWPLGDDVIEAILKCRMNSERLAFGVCNEQMKMIAHQNIGMKRHAIDL